MCGFACAGQALFIRLLHTYARKQNRVYEGVKIMCNCFCNQNCCQCDCGDGDGCIQFFRDGIEALCVGLDEFMRDNITGAREHILYGLRKAEEGFFVLMRKVKRT